MKINEAYIRGKNPDQSLCKGGILIGTKIAAAIDGAMYHATTFLE